MHSGEIAIHVEKSLADPEGTLNHQPGEQCLIFLILKVHGQNKQPSSFIIVSSSIKSFQTVLLTNIQYTASLNNF